MDSTEVKEPTKEPLSNKEAHKTSTKLGIKAGLGLSISSGFGLIGGKLTSNFVSAASDERLIQWAPGAIGAGATAILFIAGILISKKAGAFSGDPDKHKTYAAAMLATALTVGSGASHLSAYANKIMVKINPVFFADKKIEGHTPINAIGSELNSTITPKKPEKIGNHKFVIRRY